MTSHLFLGSPQCPITGSASTLPPFLIPLNFNHTPPSRIGLIVSVFRNTQRSESRTTPENLSEPVTLRDNPAPSLRPSLTYSPYGLDNAVSESVLAYLACAESREPNVWLKDDIRISWLTVLHCAEGVADPWRFAFWKYLGAVPEKIIPQLVARAESHRNMEIPDFDPTLKVSPSQALPQRRKEIA